MHNFSPHILSIKKQFKQPPLEPQPLHCLPSGALFHFIIQLSLKCFLAVYSSFPLCRCGSNLQTGLTDQSVHCCQAEHLPPSGYLPVLSGLNTPPPPYFLFISTLLYLSGAPLRAELRSAPEGGCRWGCEDADCAIKVLLSKACELAVFFNKQLQGSPGNLSQSKVITFAGSLVQLS